MTKTWLIVILLVLATAIVLAFTWQNIPYLNTALIDSGIITAISGVTTGITDIVKGKMPISTVIPLLGTAGTISIAAIKKAMNYVKKNRAETQISLNDAQSTVGSVKAMAKDAIDSVTGVKDKLQTEFNTLKTTSETEITGLKELVDVKDDKIMMVQDELSKTQADLIKQGTELKDTIKQMDEYRIALEQKSVPTSN